MYSQKRKGFKSLLMVLLGLISLAVYPISANDEILYSYDGVSTYEEDGLQLSNFKIIGPFPWKAGDTVTVEFDLKNNSSRPLYFGKPGIFVGCLDPDGGKEDFGHQFQKKGLLKGKTFHFKAAKKLDKKGTWTFWPSYYLGSIGWANHRIGYGLHKWQAARINPKTKPVRVSAIKTPMKKVVKEIYSPGVAVQKQATVKSKLAMVFNRMSKLHKDKKFKEIVTFSRQRGVRLRPITKTQFMIDVEIKVTRVGTKVIPAQIRANKGRILSTYGQMIHAEVPLSFLDKLAAMKEVRFISRPDIGDPDAVSEGVADIHADIWHAAGFTGSGLKVAVLDGTFDDYTNRQTDGDLPAALTRACYGYGSFNECAVDDDHGSRCAEIVYDIVPGADLYLVCYSGETDFLNAVDYLIGEGVDVISHSMSTYRGPQDGTSRRSQKINEARSNGIVWCNSAGNRAQQHWEGNFNDNGSGIHIWDGIDTRQTIHLDFGEELKIRLIWNDWGVDADGFPDGNVNGQDYRINLYINNTRVATQNDDQAGNNAVDPYEFLGYVAEVAGNYEIEVQAVNNTGAPEYLELFIYDTNLEHPVPDGSIPVYGDSSGAITVGAVTADTHNLMNYSGRGPTNGAGGGAPDGTSRFKPDLAAPTSVATWNGFFTGTSAATPHVAGAAALVKQRIGLTTPDQIQTWLQFHADLLTYPGINNEIGSGLVQLCLVKNPDADDALDHWTAQGSPHVGGPFDNRHFYLDTEGSQLSQDIDLSHIDAEIDAGRLEVTIGAEMKAAVTGVAEGYPYLYGYLIGTETDPEQINTYMITRVVMNNGWTHTQKTYPIPPFTRKIQIFMMRSVTDGSADVNTAYFDNICVYLGGRLGYTDPNEQGIPDGQDFRSFNVRLQGDNVISDIYFYENLALPYFSYYCDTDGDREADFMIDCRPTEFKVYKDAGRGIFTHLKYSGVPTVNGDHYHLEFPLSALEEDLQDEFLIYYWFFAMRGGDRMPDSGSGSLRLIF
jgi:subtilisin family serine protease